MKQENPQATTGIPVLQGGGGSQYRKLTQAELLAELRQRFGDDPMGWAFKCPRCGDIATGRDFREALEAHPHQHRSGEPVTASDVLGKECIGRTLGALGANGKYTGRGCDWTAHGLFRGPWEITMPDGHSTWGFPLAPAPVTAEARNG